MEEIEVYKLFMVDDEGNLLSWAADGVALVHYQVGEWSQAPEELAEKGYHLTAFRTLAHLVQYDKSIYPNRRYKCLAKGQKPLLPLGKFSPLSRGEIEPSPPYYRWPSGTVMYQWIKPIEAVT